jgi:hypothetical protein
MIRDTDSILYLLEKTFYLHDSNFNSISIKHDKFSDDLPNNYPKDSISIKVFIDLTENKDKYFDKSLLMIIFKDVLNYNINSNYDGIITEAQLMSKDNNYIFSIDNSLKITYKTAKWDVVSNKKSIELSFELVNNNTIEIHGDNNGWNHLLENITEIIKTENDHIHLFTSEYGGKLIDDTYGIDNKKIYSIKIFNWEK